MTELQSEPFVRREPFWPAAIITFGPNNGLGHPDWVRTNQAGRARDLGR
jgi:hypothetical protein